MPRLKSLLPIYRRPLVIAAGVLVVVVLVVAVLAASLGPTRKHPSGGQRESTTAAALSGGPSSTAELDDPNAPGAPTIKGSIVPAGSSVGAGQTACRKGNPLANVYHPNRLQILKPCATVSGTVMSIRQEPDGDVHFDVALDPPFTSMLTASNQAQQHGWLVAEIVPADEPGCTRDQPPRVAYSTYDFGVCTGADVLTPAVGSQVSVTGPYVLDHQHGNWAEIHPVWAVSTNRAPPAARSGAPPPPAPAVTAPAGGVRIISVTSPVRPGETASLVAQTAADDSCSLSVTLPSGARSTSQGLGSATADASGRVAWSWKIGTRTSPGTATATTTCSAGSATVQFQIA